MQRLLVVRNREQLERALAYLGGLRLDRPIRITVEEHGPFASKGSKRRRWKLVGLVAAHVSVEDPETGLKRKHRKEVWHQYFKELFLAPEEERLPNGTVVFDYPSTETMTQEEHDAYYSDIEQWAAERGVFLPPMDD